MLLRIGHERRAAGADCHGVGRTGLNLAVDVASTSAQQTRRPPLQVAFPFLSSQQVRLGYSPLRAFTEHPPDQDAQNGVPARPQGARRPKRTLAVRCRKTSD
jgi:hypothetical protein